MKTRNWMLSLAALALAAAGLAGDKDFWAQKPYTDWNEKEVERLLKSSPWAKTVTLSMGSRGMDDSMGGGGGLGRVGGGARDRDSEAQGGGSPAGGGGAGGGDFGGMRPGGGGMGGMMPSVQIVVAWNSKPVREGFVRRLLLRNPETPRQQLDQILASSSDATIELILLTTGSPRMLGAGEALEKMKAETFLQKKNKEKIPLANVILPQEPRHPVVLRFPRQVDGKPVLTLEDKEVELVSRFGSSPVRARWKLAEMVVNGKLEI